VSESINFRDDGSASNNSATIDVSTESTLVKDKSPRMEFILLLLLFFSFWRSSSLKLKMSVPDENALVLETTGGALSNILKGFSNGVVLVVAVSGTKIGIGLTLT